MYETTCKVGDARKGLSVGNWSRGAQRDRRLEDAQILKTQFSLSARTPITTFLVYLAGCHGGSGLLHRTDKKGKWNKKHVILKRKKSSLAPAAWLRRRQSVSPHRQAVRALDKTVARPDSFKKFIYLTTHILCLRAYYRAS